MDDMLCVMLLEIKNESRKVLAMPANLSVIAAICTLIGDDGHRFACANRPMGDCARLILRAYYRSPQIGRDRA